MTRARFTIAFSDRAPDGTWTLAVHGPDGAPLPESSRVLAATAPGDVDNPDVWTFPVVPTIAVGSADETVLRALTPRQLGRWYAGLAGGAPPRGVCRVFGRYLFELVLGAAPWQSITTVAAARPIELRLDIPRGECC